MKLRRKLMVFTMSVLLISLVVIMIALSISEKRYAEEDLKDYKTEEVKEIKAFLKNLMDVAQSSNIDQNITRYRTGELTLKEAKRKALENIKRIRYENGIGYFWINDTTMPYPRMIMHPIKPTLDGTILKNPAYNCAGENNQNLFQAAVQVTAEKGEGFVKYEWPKPGSDVKQPKMSFVRLIPEWNWVIGTGVYIDDINIMINRRKEVIDGQTNWLIFIVAMISLGVAFLMIIVIYKTSNYMVRPMLKIRNIVNSVSQGDLTKQINVKSNDELGEKSGHFNTMIFNFRDLMEKLQNNSGILSESIHDLASSAQEISTTSNQQAAAVKEIVSTMEDSDQLAKSINTRIDEVANVSNKTKVFVSNGYDLIKNSLSNMDGIKQSNSDTINEIKSLSDRIESIWDIVNIINGIADQTKIIAFNAELEASAAGEAGKNFQIVASEIRRLADNTVASTTEVKNKIKEIQHSSDNLIISSEEGTSKIIDGWDLSNKIKSIFNEIQSSSEISATSADQIALSIKQQVSAFDQILLTLKQISEGIDNFVISTKSTTKASLALKEMAERLNEIVDEYEVDVKKIDNSLITS